MFVNDGNKYTGALPAFGQLLEESKYFINFFNDLKLIEQHYNIHFSNFNTLITEDSSIKFIQRKDHEALNIIRYSCIQLLNYAVKKTWPSCKIGESDITKNGFYCDVDFENNLTEKDFFILENNSIRKKTITIFFFLFERKFQTIASATIRDFTN